MQKPTIFSLLETQRRRFLRPSKPATSSQVITLRQAGGFTLIELLVVISIIAILAALVLSAATFVQKKGARDRAAAEIAAIGAALESYKADNGDYPTNGTYPTNGPYSSSGYGSLSLVTNLMPPAGKVYFEFKSKSTNGNGYNSPWGSTSPYHYVYTTNGALNNGSNNYDLWSWADDNTQNKVLTNVWIKNW